MQQATPQTAAATLPTATDFGVGARFTLAAMSDEYISIIQDALAAAAPLAHNLKIITDEISTYLSGEEQDICDYLVQVISHAAKTNTHLSVTIIFSRGCSGEVSCDLPSDAIRNVSPVELAPTGITAAAQWSLYPLPGAKERADGIDYMAEIYQCIDQAKESGVFVRSDSFTSRLEGDLAEILSTIADSWIRVGSRIRHVTSHATISINSPTATKTTVAKIAAR